VLARMTARNPADRYQTPAEVAKALQPQTAEGVEGQNTSTPAAERAEPDSETHQATSPTKRQVRSSKPKRRPQLKDGGAISVTPRKQSPPSSGSARKLSLGLAVAGASLVLLLVVVCVVLLVRPRDADKPSHAGPATANKNEPTESKSDAKPG